MNNCSIPNEPLFAALRREAGLYGRHLPITVVAGHMDSEAYVIERTGQRLTVRADGIRGAAYGFHHALRLLGFGFSFFADAKPKRLVLRWPVEGNELRVKPAFTTRGFLPWGNLLNSINVWNFEDYERFLLTLWRWGCNFVWLHNYDHDPLAAFRDAKGKWSHGQPYQHSFNPPCGAKAGIRVQDFPHGTARYFPDARRGIWAARHGFARDPIAAAQAEFGRVITFAKSLGIDTGFGFEVKGDPSTPGYRAQLTRRIRHVLEGYPDLHTLCLWQSERSGHLCGWQNCDASPGYRDLHRRYARHFRYLGRTPNRLAEGVRLATLFNWACEIARGIRPSIRLAFSGWGGDRWLRCGDYWRGLHECLPPDATFAQLDNVLPRMQPTVSAAVRSVPRNRKTWTTLWIESDMGPDGYSSMWHPQDDLAQMENLVKSAARMGYSGLFAQNWNTASVELSAAFIATASWTPTLTARTFRRDYACTFFASSPVSGILEKLEALGPGWTGTSQHTEWTEFSWDSHPPFTTGKATPALAKLPRALAEAREEFLDLPYCGSYHLNALLFQCGQQAARTDAFEELQKLHRQFAQLGLSTPHARRLSATMDFVIAYEYIKRQLDSRGRLAAQQLLIQQARASGLKPDPRLLADYRKGVTRVERLWKEVYRAQAARLDTRSDLGTLATINLKAWPKWREFVNTIKI